MQSQNCSVELSACVLRNVLRRNSCPCCSAKSLVLLHVAILCDQRKLERSGSRTSVLSFTGPHKDFCVLFCYLKWFPFSCHSFPSWVTHILPQMTLKLPRVNQSKADARWGNQGKNLLCLKCGRLPCLVLLLFHYLVLHVSFQLYFIFVSSLRARKGPERW